MNGGLIKLNLDLMDLHKTFISLAYVFERNFRRPIVGVFLIRIAGR